MKSATGSESGLPAFADVLSDDAIWAVLAYIKSSWPQDIRKAQQDDAEARPALI